MTIPARVHFCWLGTSLPWAYVYAILSAAENGGTQEVVLHHTDPLAHDARLRALELCPRVRLSRLEPIACLTAAGMAVGVGEGLVTIYRRLEQPASRTDMLRSAILYLEGGVYLDLDTVTTASLVPLLERRQFVASERVIWPYFVRGSRSPALWCRSLTLDVLRKTMRRAPRGWQMFRWVEGLCYRAVTNAVMGAEANSRLCALYLRAMAAMAPQRCTQPYALGPDLLQELVDQFPKEELTIEEPEVFCPLPPQISEHWFRISQSVRLPAVLCAQTRVVHWYASVRTQPKVAAMDPQYVRKLHKRQLYSALVYRCVRSLPDMARACAA
jgi:Glycosyltransferase sugar-binding region containing DXD motif